MPKKALLIIDMLNDFVREGSPLEVPDTRKILPVIAGEREAAHAGGTPVIYVCDAHDRDDREFSRFNWPPHAVEGTAGADVVQELKPDERDIIIKKQSYSSFYHTDLEATLHSLSIDSLILTGCVTHICILFAASEAVLRDFQVSVVADGVAGLARDDHEAAIRIMKNVLGVTMIGG